MPESRVWSLYVYTYWGCQSLRAGLLHQDSIFCASRTLGCFVPLGWASLFTLILGMRQGSIQCRSHSPPPKTREVLILCPSTPGGTWDRVHDVRCELNLLAGSPVTVAYGFIGSSVRVKMELRSEMDRDSASSAESSEWEWKTDLRYCDVLVDFQTGEIPSTGQIYIYTFVN